MAHKKPGPPKPWPRPEPRCKVNRNCKTCSNAFIATHNTQYYCSRECNFKAYISVGDGCWNWTGALSEFGYGNFRALNRQQVSAHRYSWILKHGTIPNGMCVLHKCDNPRCVNTEHLFLGTHKDNTQDMLKKCRDGMTGERSRMHRFSNEQVREIRLRHESGFFTRNYLCERFKISDTHLKRIIKNESRVKP